MNGDLGLMAISLLKLLSLQLKVAVCSWVLLWATRDAYWTRIVSRSVLWLIYLVVLGVFLSRADVLSMDIFFFWLHFGFLCRMLSSIYFYSKREDVPQVGYHVLVLMWAPSQRYSAGNWSELRGRKLSWSLVREWSWHLLHLVVVASVAVLVITAMVFWRTGPLPLRTVVGVGFSGIVGLMILTLCTDTQAMIWSVRGYHRSFFGKFPFLRSRHVGMFWNSWNVWGVRFFEDLSNLLHIRRKFFLNIMTVFLVSGLLHQIMIIYYVRKVTGWTLIAFALNGLAVWASVHLYHRRHRMPKFLRVLLFNPVTTVVVLFAINLPIALDFHGVSF